MTSTGVLLFELDVCRMIEVRGVAFVGVDVNFEFARRIGPHK